MHQEGDGEGEAGRERGGEGPSRQEPLTRRHQGRRRKRQRPRDGELDRETGEWQHVAGAETHTGWEVEILRLRLEDACRRCCEKMEPGLCEGSGPGGQSPHLAIVTMGSVALVEVTWPPLASASSSEKWG